MKLVCYRHGGATHYGAVKDNGKVVDLGTRLGALYPDIVAFIAGDGQAIARQVVATEPGDFDYDALDLLPVVPNPGKILCVGLNYHDHVDEANRVVGNRKVPDRPMIFGRWPESLAAHRKPITRPRISHMFDWEAEMLVVIGRETGRYVKTLCSTCSVTRASMNPACATISAIPARSRQARISKTPAQAARGWSPPTKSPIP
jgi:hypothetical protein